jgi:hypothetical protein
MKMSDVVIVGARCASSAMADCVAPVAAASLLLLLHERPVCRYRALKTRS